MFLAEFSQNLYFICLIMNTVLYVALQQLEIDDDELSLLICGLGIKFAGEAAGLALIHVTLDPGIAKVAFTFLGPICTIGMLLVWSYALALNSDLELDSSESGVLARVISSLPKNDTGKTVHTSRIS